MKLRSLGLSAGLTFSAIALVVGISLIAMAESMEFVSGKAGGGIALLMQGIMYLIMYGIGILAAAAGGIIGLVTGISWFAAEIYSSLSPQGKKRVWWGLAILSVVCISMSALAIHLWTQPEAIAKRAMEAKAKIEAKEIREAAEQKAAEQKAAVIIADDKKCQTTKEQIKAQWAVTDDFSENIHALFREKNTVYYTNGVDWVSQGTWSLRCNRSPSEPLTLFMEITIKTNPDSESHSQDFLISHLDSKQLMAVDVNGKNSREMFTRSNIENEREQDEAISNLIALQQKAVSWKYLLASFSWVSVDNPQLVVDFEKDGTFSCNPGNIIRYGSTDESLGIGRGGGWEVSVQQLPPLGISLSLDTRFTQKFCEKDDNFIIGNRSEILSVSPERLRVERICTEGNINSRCGITTFTRTGYAHNAHLKPLKNEDIKGTIKQVFDPPIKAVATGLLWSGPGPEYGWEVRLSSRVLLLGVTDVKYEGYLWYHVRNKDGQEGYTQGVVLCTKDRSLEGIKYDCD